MDDVAEAVMRDFANLQRLKTYKFSGQINIHGNSVDVNTYLIHFHNPGAVKYVYQKSDTEAVEEAITLNNQE